MTRFAGRNRNHHPGSANARQESRRVVIPHPTAPDASRRDRTGRQGVPSLAWRQDHAPLSPPREYMTDEEARTMARARRIARLTGEDYAR